MAKDLKYFVMLMGVFLLAAASNLLCMFGVLPYAWWRWGLAVIVLLLLVVWFFCSRLHKDNEQFDLFTTKPRRVVAGVVILGWCVTFFAVIFAN